jgi:dTDP-4-amino-4,6-dideoxygalactose transaminase
LIPQYEPLYSPKGNELVQEALLNSRLGPGWYCDQFEQALKDKYGFKHVILVNSGTSAIMVAMRAMLGEGKHKVLAPSYTFLAGHNAARI